MIQEQKKLTVSEMAEVMRKLVFERGYHREQAAFYAQLFNRHTVKDANVDRLPPSPIMSFYQNLSAFHMGLSFGIEGRIETLQGIADSTMFADMDY